MAAARYLRVHGISVVSGDVVLGAFELRTALGRVDGAATLTSSHAPIAGSLGALSDGDSGTVCRFAMQDVRSAGFFIQWDFGSPQDVNTLHLAAAAASNWVESLDVSSSADSVTWLLSGPLQGIPYPGAGKVAVLRFAEPVIWSDLGAAASTLNAQKTLWTASTYNQSAARAGVSIVSGKHYWELVIVAMNTSTGAGGNALNFGVWPLSRNINTYIYQTTGVHRAYQASAQGNVFGFEFDADAGTLRVYRQGALVSTLTGLAVGPSAPWAPVVGDDNAGGAQVLARFSSPFSRTPTAGYEALEQASGLGVRAIQTRSFSAKICASAPVSPPSIRRSPPLSLARDIEFGGIGRVRNTVKEKGTPNIPLRRRVRLVRERDGTVVREQWSDPVTGEYDFQFVDALQTYTVLSYDHTLNFRAVIADGLTLANGTVELMP